MRVATIPKEVIFQDVENIVEALGADYEPQPIVMPLPKVEPCTPNMLPPVLRRWLEDEAYRMNCPLDYVAVTALSMIGSLIGSRCGVQPKEMNTEYVEISNLWGGIVAPPGAKKSPATGTVLNALKQLEKLASEEFRVKEQESKVKSAILEKRSNYLLNQAKNADEDKRNELQNELIILQHELEKARPSFKRYQVNDSTPEKLADICTENPQGVLVFRDELIGLLQSWEKHGNENARAFYLESWNGKNSHRIDRIIRGSSIVETLCLTVFGGIQPDKLRGYISKMAAGDNDGLMQRFQLLVYPDFIPFKYIDEVPDTQARIIAYEVINKIAEASVTQISCWGGIKSEHDKVAAVKFDYNAQAVYVEWFTNLNHEIQEGSLSTFEQQHFSKYSKLMSGLALIFHFVDCASGKVRDSISVDNVKLSIMWCHYLQSHAKRIYSIGNNIAASALMLSKYISSGKIPDEFTPRIILQKGWYGLTELAVIKDSIEILCDACWITDITDYESKTPGRRSYKYTINPNARNWYKKSNN